MALSTLLKSMIYDIDFTISVLLAINS